MRQRCITCKDLITRDNGRENNWGAKSINKYAQKCSQCLLITENKKKENMNIDEKWLRRGPIEGTSNQSAIVTCWGDGLPVHA